MTDEPSEDELGELTDLKSDGADVGHNRMAHSELRKQGCSCRAISYDQHFDSYFCVKCDIWADPACSDPRCGYCRQRPAAPSLVRH